MIIFYRAFCYTPPPPPKKTNNPSEEGVTDLDTYHRSNRDRIAQFNAESNARRNQARAALQAEAAQESNRRANEAFDRAMQRYRSRRNEGGRGPSMATTARASPVVIHLPSAPNREVPIPTAPRYDWTQTISEGSGFVDGNRTLTREEYRSIWSEMDHGPSMRSNPRGGPGIGYRPSAPPISTISGEIHSKI